MYVKKLQADFDNSRKKDQIITAIKTSRRALFAEAYAIMSELGMLNQRELALARA